MRRVTANTDNAGSKPAPALWSQPPARRILVLATVGVAVVLAGCGLHVSKNGVSGNILGHSFSAKKGALPTGFPGSIPAPDGSRVLGGAGTDNRWDAAFALTGSLASGTMAYESQLRSAGYTISNYQSGSTPVTASTGSASTATTVTLTGATFEASNPQWTIQVASGSTSSVAGTGLRSGEFAINLIVLPTSSTTTSTP